MILKEESFFVTVTRWFQPPGCQKCHVAQLCPWFFGDRNHVFGPKISPRYPWKVGPKGRETPTVYVWEFLSNCGVLGKFGVSFQGPGGAKSLIWGIWKGGNGFSVVESELVSLPETASWPVQNSHWVRGVHGPFLKLRFQLIFRGL